MAAIDVLIKNGKVHTEDGFKDLDVGIIGEKIAFLSRHGTLSGGTKVIDAAGQHVLPGDH